VISVERERAAHAMFVMHSGSAGGSNRVATDLIQHRPTEWGVDAVFLSAGPAVAAAQAAGAATVVIDAGRARDVRKSLPAIWKLSTLMRRRRSAVVLCHVAKAQALAGWAARVADLPTVWFQHEMPGTPRVLQAMAARTPHQLTVCNSEFVLSEHRKRWPGDTAIRWHPGVAIPAEDLATRPSPTAGSGRVVIVGRLQDQKRIELAMDGFEALLTIRPQATLDIVGTTPPRHDARYERRLRERVAGSSLRSQVTFRGQVDDLEMTWRGADVLLHCGENEAFGLVAAEALARGVPAVVPLRGGAAEIVRDSVDGYHVDPTDASSVSAAIDRALRELGSAQARSSMRTRALNGFHVGDQARVLWAELARVAGIMA
jgi:glycosyltransferase involved in cell wall biosynthesis